MSHEEGARLLGLAGSDAEGTGKERRGFRENTLCGKLQCQLLGVTSIRMDPKGQERGSGQAKEE